jgi:hypothetical protein
MDDKDVEAQVPREAGVEEKAPELAQMEGARKLADDARGRLRAEGFSDGQIDLWAETYIAEEGSGDLESFFAWVERQQR